MARAGVAVNAVRAGMATESQQLDSLRTLSTIYVDKSVDACSNMDAKSAILLDETLPAYFLGRK
jgi:hypothetical protein